MIINQVKQTPEGGYQLNDNIFVPADPANRHYQMIQDWIADGNQPEPADPEPVVDKEAEEREALIHQKMRKIAIRELQAEGKLAEGKNG